MPVRQYLRGSRRQEGALQGTPLPAWPHGPELRGLPGPVSLSVPKRDCRPAHSTGAEGSGTHVQPADSPPPRSCLPARGSWTQEPGSRIGGLLTPHLGREGPAKPSPTTGGEGAATPLPRSRRPAPRRSRGPGGARSAGCEAAHTGSLTPRTGPSPTPLAGARAAQSSSANSPTHR